MTVSQVRTLRRHANLISHSTISAEISKRKAVPQVSLCCLAMELIAPLLRIYRRMGSVNEVREWLASHPGTETETIQHLVHEQV